MNTTQNEGIRINRYLAMCGLGSRRAVEQLILEGRVSINGSVHQDLATQVHLENDLVTVDGKVVTPSTKFTYLILNKPRGYDVTRGGRHHHRRAWDLLPKGTPLSTQSVGRLDRDSTGLLIFTNDGDLAYRLTHPKFGCQKTYDVTIEGTLSIEIPGLFMEGIQLLDGPAHAVHAQILSSQIPNSSLLRIVMEEGRNRIVRRMCEAIGRKVLELNRIAIGPLNLGDLPRGKTRPLTFSEVKALRQLVGLTPPLKSELSTERQTPRQQHDKPKRYHS